jgi:hypothetical protein
MSEVKASFDVSTVEGQMRVFNAQNGASISMKTLGSDTVVEVVGVLQYQETVDTYGKEQEATVTTLFAKDGTAYAGVSDTVAKAGAKLIDFMVTTKLKSIKVKVVKAKSSKGNEFLNLQIVG